MVVIVDFDKSCLWRIVDENLIEVDLRESWRIEVRLVSKNNFFKNFRCLGK